MESTRVHPAPTWPGAQNGYFLEGFSVKTFRKVSILYPGSLGTVSGRFWGPRGEKIIEENIGSVQNLRRLLGIRWQAQLKTYEENH